MKMMSMKTKNVFCAFIFSLGFMGGCSNVPQAVFEQNMLRSPKANAAQVLDAGSGDNATASRETLGRDEPVPQPFTRTPVYAESQSMYAGKLEGEPLNINFRNMPLPDFINQVFGNILGLNFVLDPSIADAQDLVTLSLGNSMLPSELYNVARSILAEYGVAIIESSDLLRFRRDNSAAGGVPLLVTGGTLPDVPATKRKVYSFNVLEVVRNSQVRTWLQDLYRGTTLEVKEDGERNSLILSGPLDVVKQAAESAKMLDQTFFKGKFSRSFSPKYVEIDTLAGDLTTILSAEGYAVSQRPPLGSILIISLKSQRRIVIFAASKESLQHAIDWAYNLDISTEKEITDGFFSYEAQNVTAEHIVELVSVLGGEPSRTDRNASNTSNEPQGGSNSSARGIAAVSYKDGHIVYDENRNVIFFNGPGRDWGDLLRFFEEIDKPIPMVLIDVLLAEITLTDASESGAEWLFRGDGIEGTDVLGSTIGGTGLGGSGLSLIFDSAGETRALLNAFYSNDRAVIRSSPKLLVKSGEVASIDVGNSIPVITSNSQSTETAGAPVIQTIQYRKTGVALEIEPVVQSGGLVDIKVSQQLSEQTTSSATLLTGSPTILERKVSTQLSIKDGGSILIGGLISTNKSEGAQGLPLLGQLPVLGKLFRTDIQTDFQTELMMLLSVYVIDTPEGAVELTNSLKEELF